MQNGTILLDPFTLKEMDWQGESACINWPSLYFINISTYLKMKTEDVLYHRLCDEYKEGKTYRYKQYTFVNIILFYLLL